MWQKSKKYACNCDTYYHYGVDLNDEPVNCAFNTSQMLAYLEENSIKDITKSINDDKTSAVSVFSLKKTSKVRLKKMRDSRVSLKNEVKCQTKRRREIQQEKLPMKKV